MVSHIAIGVGAGLVSALLFGLVVTGSPVGAVLVYIAPLPIIIAALGWHPLCGLLAVAAGAVATSLLLRDSAALAFAFGPALPAWWLSHLTLLRRPAGPDGAEVDWYSTGRLLLWVGLLGAAVAVLAAVALGRGDPERFARSLAEVVAAFLKLQLGRDTGTGTIAGLPSDAVVRVLVMVAPAGLAAMVALLLAINLWAGAKTVAISNRLARPWPRVPDTRMPRAALMALAGGALLAFGSGFGAIGGIALVGALGLVFALQGLALLHDVSAGRAGRPALLALAYALALLFGQAFLPLMALLGMADTASAFRARLKARGRPGAVPPLPPRDPQP